jgi:D-serine deaminase-like pyridoxal phosphate-dependent protein
VVAAGLGETGRALAEHSQVCKKIETDDTPRLTQRRDELQHVLDAAGGWELFALMSDPAFYKKEKAHIAEVKADLDRVERGIETANRRWEELEAIKSKADD